MEFRLRIAGNWKQIDLPAPGCRLMSTSFLPVYTASGYERHADNFTKLFVSSNILIYTELLPFKTSFVAFSWSALINSLYPKEFFNSRNSNVCSFISIFNFDKLVIECSKNSNKTIWILFSKIVTKCIQFLTWKNGTHIWLRSLIVKVILITR